MTIGPWGGYSNGQIPDSAMTASCGVLLRPDVDAQVAAALAYLVANHGFSVDPDEGYRPLGEESDYDNGVGRTQWWYYIAMLYHGGSSAADPGTSNHGWGQAVDFNVDPLSGDQYDVFVAVMGLYGMEPNVSGESWHFADVGTRTNTAGFGSTPINQERDEDMAIFYKAATPGEDPSAYVAVGDIFIQEGNGPLRHILPDEWSARAADRSVGGSASVPVAWNVASITNLIARVGVYGTTDGRNDYSKILY